MKAVLFPLSNYSFSLHALPPLITAFSVLSLGLIVVAREKASRVSLLYLAYTLAAGIWLFSASMALFMKSQDTTLEWMRFANAGVTMIPPALYHFTAVVSGLERARRKSIRFAWIVSSLFLAVTLLTNLLFDGFYHYSWGIFLKYRLPAFFFVFFFLMMTIVTLRLYWQEYRRSDPNSTKHRRARSFLIAFGIGYLGSLDFLPALGVPYYPLSSVPMICMLILVSRAIWRYQLVDITPALAAREIIDTMNDALVVTDRDGIIRVVNRATCSLLDCREQDLVGKRPGDGMGTRREFAHQLEAIIAEGTVRNREIEYPAFEGSRRTLSLSASIMRNPGGEPIATVCLLNDITDRKRSEESREQLIAQLQAANEKLQSIDEMKTNFISMVSHELRTPLTTVKAFIELLLMKKSMPEEQKVKLMRTINIETDRVARLITDLLDLARIEARSIKWQAEEVFIEDLIRNVMSSMRLLFENKRLRVTTAFSSPLPRLSADRDRLVQVVTNILSNAVKFTEPGGAIHVAARYEPAPRDLIVVEISDTGIGIRREELDLIFEKFHRSDDKIVAGIEGTGLGLAITRQIVEHHQGRIWATSTHGRGSVFTFTLPLKKM